MNGKGQSTWLCNLFMCNKQKKKKSRWIFFANICATFFPCRDCTPLEIIYVSLLCIPLLDSSKIFLLHFIFVPSSFRCVMENEKSMKRPHLCTLSLPKVCASPYGYTHTYIYTHSHIKIDSVSNKKWVRSPFLIIFSHLFSILLCHTFFPPVLNWLCSMYW